MKTTFSYFPGMFENPAPAKIIFKKIDNFLLIDATGRSNISSDQKRFFIALSL